MKKKIIFALTGIILFIIISVIIIDKIRLNSLSCGTFTAELTPEIIERLQSYPYYGHEPKLDFKKITEERPVTGNDMVDDIFNKFNLFNKNQKFITNGKLAYRSWDGCSVVRGVLQTALRNGEFLEQDVEYEYYYGGWDEVKCIFKEMRILSDKKIIKRRD